MNEIKAPSKIIYPHFAALWRVLPRSRKSEGDNTKNHACRDKETQGE